MWKKMGFEVGKNMGGGVENRIASMKSKVILEKYEDSNDLKEKTNPILAREILACKQPSGQIADAPSPPMLQG